MHKIICKKLFALGGALCLSLIVDPAIAQQGSQGNTTIFEGAQMTVFGTHTFVTGGAGIQPGIIKTIRTTSPGVLGFASGATYSGQNDANHVDGYVSKAGTSAFIFPVGDGTKLRTIGISAPATSAVYKAAYWSESGETATLPAGSPFPLTNINSNVTAVSGEEYWDLDGVGPVDITLTWDADSDLDVLTGSNITNLLIVGYNPTSAEWESLGNAGGTTGSLAANGSITATGVTPDNYSAFTFGSNPSLPVTLIAFDARKEGTTASMTWSTIAETNSDRFEIERSAKGKVWNKIGFVASNGESMGMIKYAFSDPSPLTGENLYRLKMIDKDETFAYSSIKGVSFEQHQKQFAYPNPARDLVFIQDSDHVKSVSLIDINGITVTEARRSIGGGYPVDGLAEGLYLLRVVNKDGGVKSQKIIISR